MAHVLNELDRRLRAARPSAADADRYAVDDDLLTRVQALPVDPRRRVRPTVAIPVVAGATAAATAAVMLAGPGDVGGPSSASALTRTLRWLSPPAGTVLHARSIETENGVSTTREFWQSADHPQLQRERIEGTATYELSGDAIYDPATNTIYDGPKQAAGDGPAADKRRGAEIARSADDAVKARAIADGKAGASDAPPVDPVKAAAKQAEAAARRAPEKLPAAASPDRIKVDPERLPAGDPIVTKVRVLLQMGRATVVGRERHAGVATWAISLNQGLGRPAWRLWVDAATGRPVELRDPGRGDGQPAQVIRWTTYEVLQNADGGLLTVAAAHPSARIVHDVDQWQAAEQRLLEP